MKKTKTLIATIVFLGISASVSAAQIWSQTLELRLVMREGAAWVSSPQLPANCSPLRAEIAMTGTEYDRALFDYALAMLEQNRRIQVLVDDAVSECVVLGLRY
ncbi:MAG: hypothetical protein AB8G17_11825 [Gammaproteobacteria bacterium]